MSGLGNKHVSLDQISDRSDTDGYSTRPFCHTPYRVIDRDIVVVKIGSNSLLASDGRSLDTAYLRGIADQCAFLMKERNMAVIIVSSGACAAGMGVMQMAEKPDGIEERQALSAIGQVHVISTWGQAFAPHDIRVSQLLLTHNDFEDRKSCKNLTNTLRVLFEWGIVPIVNENDPIATAEITVGDNDRLAAILSVQVVAKCLLLLTDIDGVYDADPRFNKDAKRIECIEGVTAKMLEAAGGPSAKGRGGMRSKLESARFAAAGCVEATICHSREPNVVRRTVLQALGEHLTSTDDSSDGGAVSPSESIGTRILPVEWEFPDTDTNEHRRWVVCRRVNGTIQLKSADAKEMLMGRQPLNAGHIASTEGEFHAGDAVAIVDPNGNEIGRGIAQHSAKSFDADAIPDAGVVVRSRDLALLEPPQRGQTH